MSKLTSAADCACDSDSRINHAVGPTGTETATGTAGDNFADGRKFFPDG